MRILWLPKFELVRTQINPETIVTSRDREQAGFSGFGVNAILNRLGTKRQEDSRILDAAQMNLFIQASITVMALGA